jgi:stage III sporulation protein AE
MACQDVVLPMVLVAVAVELTGAWMPRFGLGQLGSVLRQLAVFFLGGLMTVFLGVIAMVNVAGKMSDSLALRAGKFLTNAMIPVVGKMFSDAMDVVLRSSGLLLASTGLAVGFAVIVAILFPLAKVLAVMLLYRLGAVAAEPLGVAGVGQTLTVLANGMGMLAAVAASVALMFFIVTTIVVAAAGGVAP